MVMIRYYKGTVFNAGVEAIVNTVNCDGVMGAGIALEFGLRYPDMYKDYVIKCKKGDTCTGKVDYFKDSSGIIIVNFPTKIHFKYPSKIEWIESGLKAFAASYKDYGFNSIAFPKLGTSKGGLDWKQVCPLMEKYLSSLELDVVICLDDMREAQGTEKNMLEMFNVTSIESLSRIVRLTSKQKEIITANQPYKRFWEIGRTQGIGKKTYASLFTHFYNKVNDDNVNEQVSIYDM